MRDIEKINSTAIKAVLVISLIVMLSLIVIINCTREPKKDEFTIKVFNLTATEEIIDGRRYYYDYTGKYRDFVIKVYCNGEEIYDTTLSYLLENQGRGSLVTVRTTYKEFYGPSSNAISGRIFPKEKGWYTYNIEFNRNYWWNDKTLHEANVKDFYLDFFIDYDYFMSTKEE